MSDEDEIAAFHNAAAKRDKRILIVGGVLALLGGAIALVLGLTMEGEPGVSATRSHAKVLVIGAVLVLVGIGMIVKSVRGDRD